MRSGIWRFAMAPSDAAGKNFNIGAQQQSIACPKMFSKNYFLYDFWCVQTCSLRAVFKTTDTKFETCSQRYIATCGEKII